MNKMLYTILCMICALAPSIVSAQDPIPENAAFTDDKGNYYDANRNLIVVEKPKQLTPLPIKAQPPVDTPSTTRNVQNQNKQNKNYRKEKPLMYKNSFYDSKGPRQGKMAIGGIVSQVAANVLGNIGATNKNRDIMSAAYGLQGMGEILSRVNDRRDAWGRAPGNPDYGRRPWNTNQKKPYTPQQGQNGGQQYRSPNFGPRPPYGGNNAYVNPPYQNPGQNFVPQVQPPVNPVPAVVPAQQQANRVPGTIRNQSQQIQQSNIPIGQKIQEARQDKIEGGKKIETTA